MSAPAVGGPLNGHLSSDHQIRLSSPPETLQTKNQFPDAQQNAVAPSSPSPSEDHEDVLNGIDRRPDEFSSDASGEENVSEDAEFELQPVAHSPRHDGEDDHLSSGESSRAPKRKAPAEEDEFIKANPELYGLRRSVCFAELLKYLTLEDCIKLTRNIRLDLENSVKSYATIPSHLRQYFGLML